jgi:hypothetical protein
MAIGHPVLLGVRSLGMHYRANARAVPHDSSSDGGPPPIRSAMDFATGGAQVVEDYFPTMRARQACRGTSK